MTVSSFLDTNILVYAVDSTPEHAQKQSIAQQLIAEEDFGLSLQVLQEFFVSVTRKIEVPLSMEMALAFLKELEVFPCLPVEKPLLYEGIRNALKFEISYWDGAIVAAAQAMQATRLYSEDLNSGQFYGEVQVLNPFGSI